MSVSVTVTGVPEVKARLQILKGEVLARTRKAIAATAVGVERRAKENLTSVGPSGYDAVDTGLARAGIHAVYPTAEKGLEAIVGTVRVKHAKYIEDGTGPLAGHARYRAPPPVSALLDWVRRNRRSLGVTMSGLYGAARAVAMKLFRVGTKPHPFMKPAVREEFPEFQKRMQGIFKGLPKRKPAGGKK